MNRSFYLVLTLSFLSFLLYRCTLLQPSKGSGPVNTVTKRLVRPADIALPAGYRIEPLVSGLNYPTGIAIDDSGKIYVIESGYSYGEVLLEPKLLRVDGSNTKFVANGPKNGPWTGITWSNGAFYIAEGGIMDGGGIIKITKDGKSRTIINGLPSYGDHHTNGPVIKDGYLYFGQGTATNSGVVGEDNYQFGWLKRKKNFHDIPCEDITVSGENFISGNPLTNDSKDKSTTGAYTAFGSATKGGQIIRGAIPCTGSIMRIRINGGNPELVAWGFRNPFGLAFSPDGRLYITENGFDEKGSRPVRGAGDVLWEVKTGAWYGWPDFSAGKPIVNDEEFSPKGSKPKIKPLLAEYPNVPPKPTAIFGVHSSSNGIDFSTNNAFGFNGEAFVAQFGEMLPSVGKTIAPVGFKIVTVNVFNGAIRDFAVNKGKKNGPASALATGGLERPVAVKFSPDGKTLYVVDFGIMNTSAKGPVPVPGTGVIWKITKQ